MSPEVDCTARVGDRKRIPDSPHRSLVPRVIRTFPSVSNFVTVWSPESVWNTSSSGLIHRPWQTVNSSSPQERRNLPARSKTSMTPVLLSVVWDVRTATYTLSWESVATSDATPSTGHSPQSYTYSYW